MIYFRVLSDRTKSGKKHVPAEDAGILPFFADLTHKLRRIKSRISRQEKKTTWGLLAEYIKATEIQIFELKEFWPSSCFYKRKYRQII